MNPPPIEEQREVCRSPVSDLIELNIAYMAIEEEHNCLCSNWEWYRKFYSESRRKRTARSFPDF